MALRIILLLVCFCVPSLAFRSEPVRGIVGRSNMTPTMMRWRMAQPRVSLRHTRVVSFVTVDDDADGQSNRRRFVFPVLERSHERIVSLLLASLSGTLLYLAGMRGRTVGLPSVEPTSWLMVAEASVALVWSSLILAISFLEAWVKFRAPFLKKYIAVDVGRHVFATLNAAELGLASSLWLHRLWQCYQVQKTLGGNFFYKPQSYYRQFSFTLPAIATLSLAWQLLVISPKLYLRAKSRIIEGFENALPSVKVAMTKDEQVALTNITRDVRRVKRLPSKMWHSFYALIELLKIGCLNAFAILTWIKVLS
jgi:hypothetical protein